MQAGPPLGVFSQTVQACAFDFSPERGLAIGGQIWIKQAQWLWSYCVLEISICSLLLELS